MAPESLPGRSLRFWLLVGLAAILAVAGTFGFIVASGWWRQSIVVAELHRDFLVAHPGWSFPARIVSAPVGLDGPAEKLVLEARARGYAQRCPQPGAGEYCARNGRVVPRTGDALEPLLLGVLVGPDGELREHLPLSDAPKHLLDAILAAEDRDFRAHRGVNLEAFARAAVANAREGSWAQGGSTLTMQLTRALVGRREKTLRRKLREAVFALAIDRHLGKDGVLQMYLDAPYLGQRGGLSVCGFEAASRHYFGKGARDLDLAEAATLAAILPAPARFAPDRFPEKARERRDRLLRTMASLYGYDVAAALAAPVRTVAPEPLPERFPSFLSATRAWLEAHLAGEELYGSGLVVTAGIDVAAQLETEELFEARTRHLEALVGLRPAPLQSAAALLDVEDGLVRAIWAGTGAAATSFNRATQARRQPGSAFKPLVYALAFDLPPGPDGRPRFTAASTEPNSPRAFRLADPQWRPRNVGGEYTATASLAWGLAWSQNVATASLLEELGGPRPLIGFAARLGFQTSGFPEEMGLALGQAEVTPLELAQFAGTVANGGRLLQARPVLRAVDAAGRERVGPPRAGEQVMSPQAAALTRELMRLVVDYGTGGAARGAGDLPGYRGPMLGKTGTTDRERDVWFIGATPRQAAVVWIGYDTPEPIGASASDLAAPLWGWWFGRLTAHQKKLPAFPDEPRLIRRAICTTSGKLAGERCQAIGAPFLAGTEPRATCQDEHLPPEAPGEAPPTHHESLWKRLERERLEREEAQSSAADGAPASPAAEAPARVAP